MLNCLICPGDLLWAVPTNSEVHVCVTLDGTCKVLIFSKGGIFLKKEEFGHIFVDGGWRLFTVHIFVRKGAVGFNRTFT